MSDIKNKVSKKLIVGFQKRSGDYLLGFVRTPTNGYNIDNDVTFNKWKDNNIGIKEYDNVPISGFKILDFVGHFNYYGGSDKFQLLDPRGFIVEITLRNFLSLIKNVKDYTIDGELIYTNVGKESVYLANANNINYEYETINNIDLSKIVSLKNLVLGKGYSIKNYNDNNFIDAYYIGKCKWKSYEQSDMNCCATYIERIYESKFSEKHTFVKINDDHTIEYIGISGYKDIDHINDDKISYADINKYKYIFKDKTIQGGSEYDTDYFSIDVKNKPTDEDIHKLFSNYYDNDKYVIMFKYNDPYNFYEIVKRHSSINGNLGFYLYAQVTNGYRVVYHQYLNIENNIFFDDENKYKILSISDDSEIGTYINYMWHQKSDLLNKGIKLIKASTEKWRYEKIYDTKNE